MPYSKVSPYFTAAPTGCHPQETNTPASATLPPLSPTTTASSSGGDATSRVCSGLLDAMEGSTRGGLLSLQCRVLRLYRRPITSCVTLYGNKLIMCTYKVLSFAKGTKWGITNVCCWVIHKSSLYHVTCCTPKTIIALSLSLLTVGRRSSNGQVVVELQKSPRNAGRGMKGSLVIQLPFSLRSPASQHGRVMHPHLLPISLSRRISHNHSLRTAFSSYCQGIQDDWLACPSLCLIDKSTKSLDPLLSTLT